MSFSPPQDDLPPRPSSLSPSTPEREEFTNDGKRIICQPERPSKAARTSSSSSNTSTTMGREQTSNTEISASFSGSMSLSSFIPLSISFSPLNKTQDPPTLEDVVLLLKMRRLADYKQTVYIPPSAKPSLQAPDETLFPLMEKVEEFLAGDGQVMLVLGDSGAGKSTFNRHLENQLWQDYKSGGAVPLFINLPALDRPDKDLVAEHLRRLDFSDELIWDLKQSRRFVLICDGYDESQLTYNLHTSNLLNQSGHWRAKLIITCRTQYLGQNYRDRFEPQGGSYYDISVPDLFTEAVIAPFSKDQIVKYVERYVPLELRTWVKEDYMEKLTTIPGLMGLVRNPFLLSLALGALPAVVEGNDDLSKIRISRVQLYDSFVDHWLSANKRRLRSQNLKLSRDEQRMLGELLDNGFEESVVKFQTSLADAVFQEQEGKPVVDYDHRRDKSSWKGTFFSTDLITSTLRDASLLIRAGNSYRFVHRSMLEYFYTCTICPPSFIGDEFAPHDLFYSACSPSSIVNHPLSKSRLVTEPSIVQFLAERVQISPAFKRQLHALLERSKTDEHASLEATNAITILVQAGVRFHGTDLRRVRIPGADLSGGQFDSVRLEEADLTGANLTKCWIRQADFTNARMDGVQFGELPYLEEDDMVHTCAYSLDGSIFAVGISNGDINLYDTKTWRRIRTLLGHEKDVVSLAFSPSGNHLLSGSYDTTARMWNIETGLSEFVLRVEPAWVMSVAFSPCGNQIASASEDKIVRLWDARTGVAVSVLTTGSVSGVSYSPDGALIATGGKDGVVRIFDTQTAHLILSLESRHMSIRCIAYSPNGQWIITGHSTGELEIWDMNLGELGPKWIGHADSVTGVKFSPNSKWIVSSSSDRTVKLWDAQTRVLVSMFAGHTETVYSVAFSPDGLQVASSSWDKTVRLWEAHSRGTGHDPQGSFDSVSSVAYSPDGRYLISESKDGTVRQYNADTGEQVMTLSCGFSEVNCIAYSPDGLRIATAKDSDLMMWEVSTGMSLYVITGHAETITSAAFSPCGHWIATGSNDMTVMLWEVESGELSRMFIGHKTWVTSVSFSPAGRHIVSGSKDGIVRIWELSSGESRLLVNNARRWTTTVAYSPNGQLIASNHGDEYIRIWDGRTGALVSKLENDATLICFAFSSCGKWIAACYGNWVGLWNRVSSYNNNSSTSNNKNSSSSSSSNSNSNSNSDNSNNRDTNTSEEWKQEALIRGFVGEATCIAWRPGTLEIATGSVDGSTRVWRLQTDPEISVGQVWGIGPVGLVATNAVFEEAIGLSTVNQILLTQRSRNDGKLFAEVMLSPDQSEYSESSEAED